MLEGDISGSQYSVIRYSNPQKNSIEITNEGGKICYIRVRGWGVQVDSTINIETR